MAFRDPDLIERGNYVKLNKVLNIIEYVKCLTN